MNQGDSSIQRKPSGTEFEKIAIGSHLQVSMHKNCEFQRDMDRAPTVSATRSDTTTTMIIMMVLLEPSVIE